MAIHRATTMTHSAAEARIRSDQYYNPDYRSRNISNSDPTPTSPRRKPSLSISLNFSPGGSQNRQPSLPHVPPSDPTQPLLLATHFHPHATYTLPRDPSPIVSPNTRPQDIEHTDYHRMPIIPAKASSSGAFIGFLCIALVWLIPIGIIASGGTGGDVDLEPRVVGSLFGWSTLVSVQDSSTLRPLIWETVRRGEHCLRYRTREYTARSVGGGRGKRGIEECIRSPAQIHGVELEPTFCEDLGLWSGIWGHWVVDFAEPDCETAWIDFKDEGCQLESGRHHFSATLDHLNPDDNWLIMCSTTPPDHHFNGKRLPVPTNCRRIKNVVVGTWDIPDRSCEAVPVPRS